MMLQKNCPARRDFAGILPIALVFGVVLMCAGPSQGEPAGLVHRLDSGWGFSLQYPNSWSPVEDQFVNSYTLVDVPAHLKGRVPVTARIKILSETRLDHADALSQLASMAAGLGASADELVTLAGWPALQTRRLAARPQPSQGPQFADPKVLRINSWVAADNLLIYVHASLPSDADEMLIEEVEAITVSLVTASTAETAQTKRELDQLRQGRLKASAGDAPRPESSTMGSETATDLRSGVKTQAAVQTPPSTFNQRIFANAFGEVEIAASSDGQNVVVGRQSAWVASNDGGLTFPNSGFIGAFDGGDPSLAIGVSGAFYYAGIDRNCHNSGYVAPPPALGFGQDCTGIARSTNNGVSFPINTTNPAVACPRDDPNNPGTVANRCFPDQEHIAADRVNPGGGGGDQVYSTWRNFDATDQDGALVCSQDGGVNWTAPFDLGPGSFFPRITAGGDGFVYVVAFGANYRLWKFSSCANGLALQPGFPVTVFPEDPVDCPFAGHDRCDQNPSSQTVVVDDTNPNHLYFAVADADGTPNRDASIFVLDSVDGGLTWGGTCSVSATSCYLPGDCPPAEVCVGRTAVRANVPFPAPRIMPWICATGGDAYVTWFDRRAATPCPGGNCAGVQNDLTDFYAGRVGLDGLGNLVAKGEFLISEVAHPWCGPANTAWPAPTRQALNPPPGASEACSLQPQLGGQCCVDLVDGMGNPGADGSCDTGTGTGIPCDVSDDNPGARCGAGQVCLGGGGVPRYGDYNGNACIAGRLFAAWPSGTSPAGVPPANPGAEGILFDAFLVSSVPLVSVPGSVDFGLVCAGDPVASTLQVCNTGNENLLVGSIVSSVAEFAVTAPSSGFPVQISPDFCFPFEVAFDPSNGPQAGVLTINSNDPAYPTVDVPASAEVGGGDLQVAIADSGSFGDVCAGDFADLNLTLFNQGTCNLTIGSISVDNSQFVLPQDTDFPLVLSPDADFNLPVRFEPIACGDVPVSGVIDISTDEAAMFASGFESEELSGWLPAKRGSSRQLQSAMIQLSGTSPCPDINVAIADSGDFGKVCKSDQRDLDLTLFNQGRCDLTISAIELLPDPDSFALPDDLTLPLVLSHDADFNLPLRFAPEECLEVPESRVVQITSDDPDEMTVDVDVSGASPCPSLVIDPVGLSELFAFPPTVVDSTGSLGCFSESSVDLRNNGECPLTITDISAAGADFTVTSPSVFPILLPAGEETLSATVRFAPQADADPLAPSEVTGTLTVLSDDPDFPHQADLCGESAAQSGVRILVTEISSGEPLAIDEVDVITITSKGQNTPSPVNLRFTDQPLASALVCGNDIPYHVDQETLPAADTTGANPKSSYESKAKEGNLQTTHSYELGRCDLLELELQLLDSDSAVCLLLPKGASCDDDGECCSGKCSGPAGGKTCR